MPPHPVPAGFAASIFDMDGLLIDSEILWHEAEIEILGGLGVPLAVDGCRSTKGMFVDEVTAHWYGLHPWPGATPTPDEVAVTIVDRVIELIMTKGVLKPGAEHAIDLCRDRGLPLAVASSSQYRLIDAALAHFGLRDRFDLVHSAEDEDYGKPHPAVFLTAAAKLGAPPRRCLVWEDAPAGVLAAKASSMTCIAVPEEGEGHHPAFGLADLVVDSLLEVTDASLDALERGASGRHDARPPRRRPAQIPLQPGRHLAVARHGNEVHAVEGARLADADDQIAGGVDAGVAVLLQARHEVGRDGQPRNGEVAGHAGAGDHDDAGVDGHVDLAPVGPPGQQVVEREADLHAEEVGRLLPRRQGPQPGGRAEAHGGPPHADRRVPLRASGRTPAPRPAWSAR